MKCPICGNKKFLEKKYDNAIKLIDFTDRTIMKSKKVFRKKLYVCMHCGFSLYGRYATQIRKEIKYLEEVENGSN